MRTLLFASLLLGLAGCGLTPSRPAPTGSGVELLEVPFFPQAVNQCGPAALATVLVHSGADADPQALSGITFLPDRQGSLQAELLAAARRHGRVPLPVPGDPEALLRELKAGHPVLILQNLGIDSLPRWHYAVVMGYDSQKQHWLLRSGIERRRKESHAGFLRRWDKADNWAQVVLPPGQLPAAIRPRDLLLSLANSEQRLPPEATLQTWEAALARWPAEHDLRFATANAARRAGDSQRAAQLLQTLLENEPTHDAARNNYADLLLEFGCGDRARAVLEPALKRHRAADDHLAAILRQTARDSEASQGPCQLP